MRPAAFAALAVLGLSLAGSASRAASLPPVFAFSRAPATGGGVFVLERSGRVRVVARKGLAPAWSPDGRRLAYVAPSSNGSDELYVADADGANRARLTHGAADEAAPDWSPDGRRLVVERAGRLLVVQADGSRERRLASGREPAWSPLGGAIAFAGETGDLYTVAPTGRGMLQVTSSAGVESEPAWSPDGGRLAFVSLENGLTDVSAIDLTTGVITRLTQDDRLETSPRWSPDGRSVVFVSDRSGVAALWSVPAAGGDAVLLGGPPSVQSFRWRPRISPELPPDLDQKPPADLSITVREGERRRFLLGFTSASDNVGEGPLSIVASRSSLAVPTMRAAQRVRVAGGGSRVYPRVGFLRFTVAFPHQHWHLMDFQRYELRRASNHSLVVRDRKSGFCLADHWAKVAGPVPRKPRRPVFMSNCGQGNPRALAIAQGTSVGYTDRYPAHFHGQNLDVTRLRAGTYVLVHRANSNLSLRELRYENNAASLRIRLSWPRGRSRAPAIRVLRTCPGSEWCGLGVQ